MKKELLTQNNKERHAVWLLAAFMALAVVIGVLLLPNTVQTAEAAYNWEASGSLGPSVSWTLKDQKLTVYGYGEMTNFGASGSPFVGTYGNHYCLYRDIKEIEICEGVTSIGQYAFQFCKLSSITLPSSLTFIYDTAFNNATVDNVYISDLRAWVDIGYSYDATRSNYRAIGHPIFAYSDNAKLYLNEELLTDVIIPSGVRTIGNAFDHYKYLESITIPASVNLIYGCAFYECNNLKTIRFLGSSPPEFGSHFTSYSVYHNRSIFTGVNANAYYPGKSSGWADFDFSIISGSNIAWISIESITLASMPTKQSYIRNEELDTSGLSINVFYGDGNSELVTTGYTVSGFDSSTPGEKTVTVSYGTERITFNIVVEQPVLQSIAIAQKPAKLEYERNEVLITDGLLLNAVYNDITERFSTGYTTDYDFSTPGEKTVTVSYGGKTTSFTVTVKVPVWNAIAVTTPPDKTMYEMNEALDTTGLAVSKVYSDKSSELITEGYEVSGFDSSTWGNKTVTVSYSGMSTTFTVYVGEPGDLDGNGKTTDSDAIYLLMHTFFPEDYPVSGDCDYNGDGKVTDADAIYLLMYTFFPEDYPLVKPNKKEELI